MLAALSYTAMLALSTIGHAHRQITITICGYQNIKENIKIKSQYETNAFLIEEM